jgi:hypothetical protein
VTGALTAASTIGVRDASDDQRHSGRSAAIGLGGTLIQIGSLIPMVRSMDRIGHPVGRWPGIFQGTTMLVGGLGMITVPCAAIIAHSTLPNGLLDTAHGQRAVSPGGVVRVSGKLDAQTTALANAVQKHVTGIDQQAALVDVARDNKRTPHETDLILGAVHRRFQGERAHRIASYALASQHDAPVALRIVDTFDFKPSPSLAESRLAVALLSPAPDSLPSVQRTRPGPRDIVVQPIPKEAGDGR